ncbi:MAG: GTPase HflX [Candidatus Bipolaricaulaceae bacterium]
MAGKRRQLPLIEDYLGRRARVYGRERAILVDVVPEGRAHWEQEELMDELATLCRTAGVQAVGRLVQRRSRPDPATYVGRGKVAEARAAAQDLEAEVLVFGDELSPAQARNLEEATGLKVVDRAQVILDIFAQRAGTKEAELAVELAQLEYLLPRLRGWGQALTDPGGGIGTRGPGETRLELDRRRVRRRIQVIRAQLRDADRVRRLRSKRRRQAAKPQVAIVGYTNSGKSTLFCRLTGAQALVENKLFATLDARVRQGPLPGGRPALFYDTVGFIRRLPHQLVPAFQATLESAREADLLLVVVDAASPGAADRLATVRRVLAEDVFGDHRPLPPVLYVLNKLDLVDSPERRAGLARLQLEATPHVAVSARNGDHLEELLAAVGAMLAPHFSRLRIRVPMDRQDLVARLAGMGQVEDLAWSAAGAVLTLVVPSTQVHRVRSAPVEVMAEGEAGPAEAGTSRRAAD